MRISNILHYTEHHRYYIFRDFSLSAAGSQNALELDLTSRWSAPLPIPLYQQLYQQVAEGDRSGYSPLEPQRKLFLGPGAGS